MSNTEQSVILPAAAIVNPLDKQAYLIDSRLNRMRTATMVEVMECSNSGGVSQVGTVTVRILVKSITGDGSMYSSGEVYSVPYTRVQGGSNAIIIDPDVGDIGICVFADRDISKVKANLAESGPGSGRKYSLADALYVGGVLNKAPAQYIQFTQDGITITSPQLVTINAKSQFNDDVYVNGSITATSEVTGNGIALSTHVHGGVESGSSQTTKPE